MKRVRLTYRRPSGEVRTVELEKVRSSSAIVCGLEFGFASYESEDGEGFDWGEDEVWREDAGFNARREYDGAVETVALEVLP